MSTKNSLFLTQDNEHCYSDCSEPTYKDGKWIGDNIILEMDKRNVEIVTNDDNDLIIRVTAGSELYKMIERMNDDY
jgi:hypothetical protein